MGGSGKQLETFYSSLFGWKIESNNPQHYGLIDKETSALSGGVGPSHDNKARVTVYVGVADLQKALDRAEELGGKTILPPSEVPGGQKLAMFADPAGNIVGLFIA